MRAGWLLPHGSGLWGGGHSLMPGLVTCHCPPLPLRISVPGSHCGHHPARLPQGFTPFAALLGVPQLPDQLLMLRFLSGSAGGTLTETFPRPAGSACGGSASLLALGRGLLAAGGHLCEQRGWRRWGRGSGPPQPPRRLCAVPRSGGTPEPGKAGPAVTRPHGRLSAAVACQTAVSGPAREAWAWAQQLPRD